MKKLLIILLILIATSCFAENYDLLPIFPKIVGIGDSLMSGELETVDNEGKHHYYDRWDYSWVQVICRKSGSDCKLYTRGGLTTKDWMKSYAPKFIEDKCKAPCFFIALGTNDCGRAVKENFPMGTINDTSEDNTFVGQYKKILETIRKDNPDSIIFLCSLYNALGKNKQTEYSGIIEELAKTNSKCYYLPINTLPNNLSDTKYKFGHYDSVGYLLIGQEIYDMANKVLNEHMDDLRFIALNQ